VANSIKRLRSAASSAVCWLGHPIIAEFLKVSPGGLTVRQRKILEASSRARFSLFEVQEVRAGSGVRLKDLLAGGEFFVYDVSNFKAGREVGLLPRAGRGVRGPPRIHRGSADHSPACDCASKRMGFSACQQPQAAAGILAAQQPPRRIHTGGQL
jgi:hypothetical protein